MEANLTTGDLTYGELREQSVRFAAALAGLGVRQGDRIGVLMGKSAELVFALLGSWRRGAVHIPLSTPRTACYRHTAWVVRAPDELRGEVIEAYVVLRPGAVGDDELVRALQDLVKRQFAAHAYPRAVYFVDALPKTRQDPALGPSRAAARHRPASMPKAPHA